MIQRIRLIVFVAVLASIPLCLLACHFVSGVWAWPLAVSVPLAILGTRDLVQTKHSLLRNYPLVGHLRFLIEDVGPELRQYIVEDDTEGAPFTRDQRSVIYQRAKSVVDKKPFGTELDVYGTGYTWLQHSMAPRDPVPEPWKALRVDIGGPEVSRPYSASLLNVSAMSFGSLGERAVLALGQGAKTGGFAVDTGEGGISRYHADTGCDLVWQIGTGYFGCRRSDGGLDYDLFAERARDDHVKMIEIKISQGAKPGHGGVLPAAKITREIAEARGVPMGRDCISPPHHTAFRSPVELLELIARLRELSGGKPVGFKLCIGDPAEFLAVCKAMLETGLAPDFVVVDGAEGGTGAAPLEFSDYVGMPLREGLAFVRNALVGTGLRERVRIGASGKRVTGFGIANACALGADWCNTARGFMFALGCIQAQRCHTNQCPVGITTQSPRLQRALVVREKAPRVANFHRNTIDALAAVTAAAGFEHPNEIGPEKIWERVSPAVVQSWKQLYAYVEPGQLLDTSISRLPEWISDCWRHADARRFRRA